AAGTSATLSGCISPYAPPRVSTTSHSTTPGTRTAFTLLIPCRLPARPRITAGRTRPVPPSPPRSPHELSRHSTIWRRWTPCARPAPGELLREPIEDRREGGRLAEHRHVPAVQVDDLGAADVGDVAVLHLYRRGRILQ